MPVLEIPRDEIPRLTELRITGIMLYPKDATAHSLWMLRNLLALVADQDQEAMQQGQADEDFRQALGSWLGANVHDHGGWGALADATVVQQTSGVQAESKDRRERGKQAGALLLQVLSDDSCRGIKHAAEVITDAMTRKLQGTPKAPRTRNPDSLRNHVWPDFRPSAHLWAAFMARDGFTDLKRGRWLPLTQFRHGGLAGFIELAESIRQAGAERLPRRGPRAPILPPSESWTLQQLA